MKELQKRCCIIEIAGTLHPLGGVLLGRDGMKYQILPPLSEEEYQALKQDIAERGVMVPVEYDEKGEILDGHHRVKACQELGIKEWPSIVRLGMTEEEKIEHVFKLNLYRRHLSKEWKQQKARELRQQGWSYPRIAKVLGVTDRTIINWLEKSGSNFFEPENSNNSPRTITGRDGKQYPAVKPRPAQKPYVVVDKPKDVERVTKAAEVAENVIPAKRVELKRLERIAREAKKDVIEDAISVNDADIQLYHCDFRELNIEPGTVDLIFTDPPYPKKFLPLWSDLGEFAARVLKPGSLLVTYTPQYWLPEILEQLKKHLKYVWIGGIHLPGAHSSVRPYCIWNTLRPLLFFSNGEYKPEKWFEDAYFSESRQKDLHEWQQSLEPAMYYIKRLTLPGQLVVDPFLGSGTFAVAAKKLGRRFIGCDIDAGAVAVAKQRVSDTV